MFCKYCGQPVVEGKCSRCGKEAVYISHSTELEEMMMHSPAPAGSEAERVPEKTYEQGFDAGYQKGLAEGYRNGVNEAQPAPPPVRHIPWKLVAALCGITLIIGAAAGGILFRNIGFRDGRVQGEMAGNRAAEEAGLLLDEKYSQGIEAGKTEGYNLGFEAGKTEGYDLGLEAGKKEGYSQGKADGLDEAEAALANLKEKRNASGDSIPPSADSEILFSRTANGSIKSQEVSDIQEMLYELNLYEAGVARNAAVDGKFGRQTESAVRKFQEEKGLPASGNIDRVTYDALLEAYSSGKEDSISTDGETGGPDEKTGGPDETENEDSLPADDTDPASGKEEDSSEKEAGISPDGKTGGPDEPGNGDSLPEDDTDPKPGKEEDPSEKVSFSQLMEKVQNSLTDEKTAD